MFRFVRFGRPSPSMIVALLALVVAMGGAASASPLSPRVAEMMGLAKNSVTTKQVKDRSLLAKDFKAGQLPAGATGPQGPAGAAGPGGAAGPAGAAGSARAYTFVKVDSPQQPTLFRNKGFSSVRSPQPGYYCLTAPGLDPSSMLHIAGQFTDGPQYVDVVVAADGGGQQCTPTEFQVNTFIDSPTAASANFVEFWVAVL